MHLPFYLVLSISDENVHFRKIKSDIILKLQIAVSEAHLSTYIGADTD